MHTYNVDIFIIVFIFSYCNIRYVVLCFGEIKAHYHYYNYYYYFMATREKMFVSLLAIIDPPVC